MIFGIVTASMLAARRYPENLWVCDGIELRADGLPPNEIDEALEAFSGEKRRRKFKGPVIFTLRLQRDGGAWENARSRERESIWLALTGMQIPHCDFMDVEIEEASSIALETWDALKSGAAQVLLSHHSFTPAKPEVWEEKLELMRGFNPAAVKFAVAVKDSGEASSLLRFGRKVAAEFPLCCVLGMGEAGSATRVISPLLGCPITYAFVEGTAVAPGQLSLKQLRALLTRSDHRPALNAAEEQWIGWAEKGIQEMNLDG